jgi:aminopeptidase N
MMTRLADVRALLLSTVFLCAMTPGTSVAAQPPLPDPDPGVPWSLAEARARTLSDVRYDLGFVVPATKTEPVTGRVRITVTVASPIPTLVLDFAADPGQVSAVEVDGRAVPVRQVSEHLTVSPDGGFPQGTHEISVQFTAGDAPLNRAEDFLYTLFVPARARLAFPCFDQPNLKARVTLTLEIPATWQAVANGAELDRRVVGDRVHLRFAETSPLPTYLVAFAAGRLSVETATRGDRTFRMFHRETDARKVARNREAVFDLHAAALAWLEDYTGIPYPWGKFDFFLAPAFQFGGMEHAGSIFYNASSLLLDETATTNQLLGRASLIAHETAHMWFGDLVTMRWFDDVWMKEVFANFMAAKIVNPSFPAINHDLRFLFSHYPSAYEVDRSAGTHPVRQALDNLKDAGSLYGPIIYQKAPIAMRHLEHLLGEASLREGLRAYLTRFSFANASWPDLIALLDARTPEDLTAWSRVWIEDLGRPTIEVRLERDTAGHLARVQVTQSDPLRKGRLWPQPLVITAGAAGMLRSVSVRLRDASTHVTGLEDLSPPAFVLASGAGLGYGRFELDDDSRAWLTTNLPDVADALTRGSALVTLWDEVLDGHLAAADFIDLLRRAIPREADELILQRALTYLESAFWRFSTPTQRQSVAGHLEAMLREGLERASPGPVKAAWFQTYGRIATTPSAVADLERLWSGAWALEGLTLAETDLTRLAQELAVRGIPNAEAVLDEQALRIDNPDRKARFAFVRPALSADPAIRERFFHGLSDVAQRRREPWVVEALGYLHHPLRAAHAERFVRPSLEMLETIQRTGDIFFPKRWMDATLSGHQSTAVARAVDDFLHDRPDYPARLRRIVLQSADELFRASQWLTPAPR